MILSRLVDDHELLALEGLTAELKGELVKITLEFHGAIQSGCVELASNVLKALLVNRSIIRRVVLPVSPNRVFEGSIV